ncbi:hypothetical protein LMG29739_04879 [Paraburkholderia solisilvae]|uniref:Uncharacterized protein n=1 Tax=Paraburkholderia solisilvae TaxID=624376 RepID=A0A6J5EJB5_9BURK|nr:hypothetical protein LMG29739_04879 [Paraburkholderia solisilvae]
MTGLVLPHGPYNAGSCGSTSPPVAPERVKSHQMEKSIVFCFPEDDVPLCVPVCVPAC